MTEEFTLAMTSGQLQLRGADPFALESPTSISGTNTDGQLSGVELVTPTVSTVRDVPEFNTTAAIDASFSMVEPGVGSINEQRTVTVQVKVAVDLRIVVPLLPGASVCRAAPVVLTLTSTGPHDEASGRVTLRAANFSVPPVVGTPECNGVLVDPVNDALAGSGHSLTLVMEGDLTAPPVGERTATALAVSPAGRSDLGEAVTLTATVTPAPEIPGAPPLSGVVTFTHDGTTIGSADVAEDGTATLVTTALPAGPLQLQALYNGAPPHWDPSSSTVVAYTVTAPPFLTTTAAGEVRIGGPGRDLDMSVHNTGYGVDLDDARLEITIRRQSGTTSIGPVGPGAANPRVTLSELDGDTTTPIPLTFTPVAFAAGTLTGQIGEIEIPAGGEHSVHLRLQIAAGTDPGPLTIEARLLTGPDGPGETTLATTTGVVTMLTDARLPITIDSGGAGFPPFVPPGVPITPRVRQGNVAELENLRVTTAPGAARATGSWTVFVDGVAVLAQHMDLTEPGTFEWAHRVPVSSSAVNSPRVLIQIPATVTVGTHQVTVRYSGDDVYAPAQRSWPITVEERIGVVYDCVASSVVPVRFTANIEVEGALPSLWPVGQPLPADRVNVRMRVSRTLAQVNILTSVGGAGKDWRLETPGGTLTPATVTETGAPAMVPADTGPTDHLVTLSNASGTLTVDPSPGATDTYTLDTISITAAPGGFSAGFICSATDEEPHTFGTITSAGTTLTAEPGTVVGEGRDVALTATALPAADGFVEFRDGTTTIGVVPVDTTGTARITTDDLPIGTRRLTARFFGGLVATLPSVPVELRVAACGDASEPGNGAVVRLVYLELLGRCPDPAGYDYWVDRLAAGTSPEAFARSIARTPEAVGRVVDDAYETMLGRPADAAGRAFWTGRLRASGRYDQLLADLAASGEFWSKAGASNGGAVTRIYERLLERSPDQGGLDYWVGRLDGGVSRRGLVLALANLAEPLGVLVDDAFGEILDRKPMATERSDGIVFLRSTGDRSGLYAQLIGTGEFHDRAQGLPDPD